MTVSYFPFNSVVVDGVPDRPANAETLAAYLAGFFSDGVIMQSESSLKISAGGGMNLQVQAGLGVIGGKVVINDAAEMLQCEPAGLSQDRIDRVIFRKDEVNRKMELAILTGTPGSSPVAPELTKSVDVYEMCLAECRIPAGASELLDSYITDTRADGQLCGYSSIPPHMQDVAYGGTGAATAEAARKNLGVDISADTVALYEALGFDPADYPSGGGEQ